MSAESREDVLARIRELIRSSPVRSGQRWKHTKTGHFYMITTVAIAEAVLSPMVVYKAEADGTEWVRSLTSFTDLNDEGLPRFRIED